jgi:ABC-type multidrug transport system fused ATPase/permease subunit
MPYGAAAPRSLSPSPIHGDRGTRHHDRDRRADGPTGAGKTTLTALACRLYDPTLGSIELDGTDLRELAFLQDPDLAVLDEATAHLDTRTEEAVRRALTYRLAGRTRIVVGHRLGTIVHADQILVLDAGRIVERGTHAELLASGSLCPALFRRGLPGR